MNIITQEKTFKKYIMHTANGGCDQVTGLLITTLHAEEVKYFIEFSHRPVPRKHFPRNICSIHDFYKMCTYVRFSWHVLGYLVVYITQIINNNYYYLYSHHINSYLYLFMIYIKTVCICYICFTRWRLRSEDLGTTLPGTAYTERRGWEKHVMNNLVKTLLTFWSIRFRYSRKL